ncbi:MAG: hypothetical protein DSO07_12905 [Thermoproteota archaeon]|jgi:chromosome segregation ATPase|uniref:Uncharacterized protein n=1 Tax=Candidatus Methanodesulfokora washburnensis TaxID=2478471 RepID=A0A3R9PK15_9CREN|nr:hypothetical protein [Candidatus Methanodesulfokores washburnensis]RSN75574.1 hypothetical protein D6D85_05910 [Candidatus Methanodesulfokores washburnensis]TDA37133.1 MAG: hypothetical protein DSO07_12905 [Candidatus Korarchaeota archaeon]
MSGGYSHGVDYSYDLSQRIGRVENSISLLTSEIEAIKSKINSLEGNFLKNIANISTRLDNLNTLIVGIRQEFLADIKQETRGLKQSIAELNKDLRKELDEQAEKVIEEVVGLNRSIETVDNKVASLEKKSESGFITLKKLIDDLKEGIERLHSLLTSLTDEIDGRFNEISENLEEIGKGISFLQERSKTAIELIGEGNKFLQRLQYQMNEKHREIKEDLGKINEKGSKLEILVNEKTTSIENEVKNTSNDVQKSLEALKRDAETILVEIEDLMALLTEARTTIKAGIEALTFIVEDQATNRILKEVI